MDTHLLEPVQLQEVPFARAYQFAANNLIYIVRLSEHDLAQQHVLERGKRLAALYRIEPLEGFIEVRESGLKVTLVGRMQDAGLQIKRCLNLRGAVDRIRCGTSGCEGRTSLQKSKEIVIYLISLK